MTNRGIYHFFFFYSDKQSVTVCLIRIFVAKCVRVYHTEIIVLIENIIIKVCEGQHMLLSVNKYWQKIQQVILAWCWH